MRISSIATPLEAAPQVGSITINSTTYKTLALQLELGKADKDNAKVLPMTALYICPPDSRQARAIAKFLADRAANPSIGLGLKLNCLTELIDKYQYQAYTGPIQGDDDATAKEAWFRTVKKHFQLPGSEDLFDLVIMNGEVDTVVLSAWGKRTIVTSDNSQLTKGIGKTSGKPYTRVTSAQFSVINKRLAYQNCILFADNAAKETVNALPDWSVVAMEGRLSKSDRGLAISADYVIPVKIGKEEEVGDAQSDDASVRSASFQESQSFGSVEDY